MVMMSATGLIARTTPSAMDVFNARSASDERLRDDQITTIFETSTRATYGLVTSAGRLVLAHVVDLPALPAAATVAEGRSSGRRTDRHDRIHRSDSR